MINLNFTEKELETLKDYFQSELYKTEQKIDSIRGILGKIGQKFGKVIQAEETEKGKSKPVGRPKSKIEVAVERKKPGRKPKAKIEVAVERKKPGPKPKARIEVEAERKKPGPKPKAKIEVGVERKKPGPKPKARLEVAAEKKKPGRKPKNATVVAAAVEIPVIKARRGRPPVKKEGVVKTAKRSGTVVKEAVTVSEKPKRGRRPALKKEVAVTRSGRKPVVKAEKKKEPKSKAPKIPWGDWVLNVLRDHDQNLTQEQIISNIAQRLQLSGVELTNAQKKIKDYMVRLLKSKKILPAADDQGNQNAFSLKISGKVV